MGIKAVNLRNKWNRFWCNHLRRRLYCNQQSRYKEDASEIEITLNNKKSYKAKLRTDSKMDIALLKIDADDKLPYTAFCKL
jgi:hypothetical protein